MQQMYSLWKEREGRGRGGGKLGKCGQGGVGGEEVGGVEKGTRGGGNVRRKEYNRRGRVGEGRRGREGGFKEEEVRGRKGR